MQFAARGGLLFVDDHNHDIDGTFHKTANEELTRVYGALRPLRREMQIVFQDPFGSLSPRLSVTEIVAEGLKIHKIGGSDAERVRSDLGEHHLDPLTQ